MRTQRNDAWKRWAVFVAVAASLCMLLWAGWTLLKDSHVIDHVSSIQSDTAVTIGVPDAPSSIDIRTDDNPAIEQALLGNVYETLVSRGGTTP